MLIVGLVLSLIIYFVMQSGNAACGKTVGTLMGCGVIVVPLMIIGIVIFVICLPFILGMIPVLAFFGALIWIWCSIMNAGKPKKPVVGDGSGVVFYATRAEFEAAQAAKR